MLFRSVAVFLPCLAKSLKTSREMKTTADKKREILKFKLMILGQSLEASEKTYVSSLMKMHTKNEIELTFDRKNVFLDLFSDRDFASNHIFGEQ